MEQPNDSSTDIDSLQKELASLRASHDATWRPGKRMPLFASVGVGVLSALSPASIAFLPPSVATFVSTVLSGIAVGLAMYYGMRSGGQNGQ